MTQAQPVEVGDLCQNQAQLVRRLQDQLLVESSVKPVELVDAIHALGMAIDQLQRLAAL